MHVTGSRSQPDRTQRFTAINAEGHIREWVCIGRCPKTNAHARRINVTVRPPAPGFSLRMVRGRMTAGTPTCLITGEIWVTVDSDATLAPRAPETMFRQGP